MITTEKRMRKAILSHTALVTLVGFCALVGVSSASVPEKINAYTDYDTALAAAAESGKQVMIDFYFDT